VEEGDRIAQLIIERIYTPDVLEVDVRYLSSVFTSSILILFHSRIWTRHSEGLVASVPREVMDRLAAQLHEK
jgi:hypothetical protein